MTALLQMLAAVAVHGNCNVTVPVFDGKRRFDITGADAGNQHIDAQGYGSFTGTARALRCRLHDDRGRMERPPSPAASGRKAKPKQGRDPFHIWLAHPGGRAAGNSRAA